MYSNWRTTTWGELATIEYGKGLLDYRDSKGEFPVYGTNGKIGKHTESLFDKAGVIIGRKGAYRGVNYSKTPFFVIDTAFYLKPKVEFDLRWAYYQLLTQDINSMDSGSAIPSTSRPDFYALPVNLPPLSEQRAIAGILGALDDKIDVNRHMNTSLESMANTVFCQWFLRNIEIDTWEVKTLGEILAILETGSRPKGGVTQEPIGIPSVGAESIVKIGSFDFSKTKYVSNEFYESMRRGHIEDRDVLLYKDGGRPGEFEPHVTMFGDGFPFEKFSINEHVYRMRVSPPLSQAYFYFWLESNEIMEEMRNRGTGVAIPGLNSTALSGISISIPPEKLLNDFSNYVEPLINKIFANAKESRTLASLRDNLLPKLIRGEVSVKNVEIKQE